MSLEIDDNTKNKLKNILIDTFTKTFHHVFTSGIQNYVSKIYNEHSNNLQHKENKDLETIINELEDVESLSPICVKDTKRIMLKDECAVRFDDEYEIERAQRIAMIKIARLFINIEQADIEKINEIKESIENILTDSYVKIIINSLKRMKAA